MSPLLVDHHQELSRSKTAGATSGKGTPRWGWTFLSGYPGQISQYVGDLLPTPFPEGAGGVLSEMDCNVWFSLVGSYS